MDIVLNTSFNVSQELPQLPLNAHSAFSDPALGSLVIGNWVLDK